MKSGRLKIGHSCLRVAASVAVVKAILAGLVFGQTWNGGTGNWGTASNWTPATVPNSSNAVSTFNAVTGSSPSVSLTGAPFTVGTLKLNNNVNGGFTFEGGTLRLAGSTQNGGTALVDIQSHDPSPDFDASARIVLQADTEI